MKSILKKAGIALFTAGALLFASCQNDAFNVRDDYKESVGKTEKAYLTVRADFGDARTVLPEYTLSDFDSWTLDFYSTTVWTGTSYDELKAAVIPVEKGEQTFTLTASKSGTTFSATETVNVQEGKNSVNFILKLSQYSTTGTGDANVSVKFKAEGTSAKVATAWYKMNENAPAALTVTDVDVVDGYATAVISKTNVDAGMYYAAFYLYDKTGTAELTHHKELVRIVGDMTSSADVKVDDYSVCDIDWKLGFASRIIRGLPAALTVPATVAYGTTIELPEDVFGYGAIFTGWKINDETEVTDKTELTVTDDIKLTTTWRYRTVKNVKAKAGVTGQIVLEWEDEEEPLPEDNNICHYHSKVRVYEASIFDDPTTEPYWYNSAKVEKDERYLGEFDSADEKAAINGLEIGKTYKLKVAVITYYDYMAADVTGFTEGGIDVEGEVTVPGEPLE